MNLTRFLNQTAVYWGSPTPDGYGGKTFSSGVEVSVRWEDKAVRFINKSGEEVVSRSIVYASQDFDVNGYLFLGDLDDLSSASEEDPTQEHEAYEIRAVDKTSDIKGTTFLRKAML